ncbi:hypothetical protein D210916BOD24_13560 [Alteromonas sp. D210916BOD_24]|uniref:hypothetical protein n=1 Tax=Alteromonas sp. D210916BOD_24 TaxID=3157618 RepID=UPI00399C6A51
MTELTDDEICDVSGASLEIHCCSIDLGIFTVKWDVFVLDVGASLAVNYGDNFQSAYNRL